MKAISVKQPWASLIALGIKTIECRSWKTNYRGDLLICSSQSKERITNSSLLGKSLCVVELLDIEKFSLDFLEKTFLPDELVPKALTGYAWKIRLKYEVIPINIRGKLNLYQVDDNIIKKLPALYQNHLDFFTQKNSLKISKLDLLNTLQ